MLPRNAFCSITRFSFILLLLFGLFVFSGCDKESAMQPEPQTDLSATEDAAESMASAIGEETGGIADQASDLMAFAEPGGFSKGLEKLGSDNTVTGIDTSYDAASGIWTITLTRERGLPELGRYAYIYRLYTLQFLNAAGQPQKFYVTSGDTANTINFNIVEGNGRHKTLRLSQRLKTLTANWVATNTHTRQITLNGTYNRAAEDTVTTRNARRTLDHTLTLNVIDLTGPRGIRTDRSQAISGRITGTYEADITFLTAETYRERSISRTFDITIGGGTAVMNVDSQTYSSDVQSGEMTDAR